MKKKIIIVGLVLTLLPAFLLLAGIDFTVGPFLEPFDLYENNLEKVPRYGAVDSELQILLESFVSETRKSQSGNSVSIKGVDYFYSVPIFVGSETYYVAIKVDRDDTKKYKKIADETMDYLYGKGTTLGTKTLQLQGVMGKLDDEVYEYMVEWFEETEFFETREQLEKYVLPLEIKECNLQNYRIINIVVILVMVAGIVLLIFGLKKDAKYEKAGKKLQNCALNINGKDYPILSFEKVDKYVFYEKNEKAEAELMKVTGLSSEDAKQILAQWENYYR